MDNLIVTGRGLTEVIAKEGSLKLKEIAYMHAEAFPSGEFKHGPLAMIGEDGKMPVVVIILNDQDFENNLNTLE
jgi:glutamine---fructose-6-phosphate transaminase (isomerizing)